MGAVAIDMFGVALSFAAGVFSLLSPCGYALLPGYLSYYLGSNLSSRKAILGGLLCTAGLVAVFSTVGALASALEVFSPQLTSIFSLTAGLIVALMGLFMILEVRVPQISKITFLKTSQKRGLFNLLIFGLAYGMASVGCSAPIFLSMILYAASRGFINGVAAFVAFAAGMGVPLTLTGVLVAEARVLILKKITDLTPRLHRISGLLLVAVGLYMVYSSAQQPLQLGS